jgi:hypothetical protein
LTSQDRLCNLVAGGPDTTAVCTPCMNGFGVSRRGRNCCFVDIAAKLHE